MPWRQLVLMLTAFVLGSLIAGGLGAASLGIALGVGQLTFAAALAWVLLS